MSATALVGADLITPAGRVTGCALVVAHGRIAAITPREQIPAAADILDLRGGVLVSGFIDTQVNGGGGVLLNDEPTLRGIRTIAAVHARFGTTGLMPTLISDNPEKLDRVLDAVDAAIAAGVPGVLGVHIEGPFLNPTKRGVHDPSKLRRMDEASLERLARPGVGRRMLTLAPELAPPGAIAELTRAGVLVCAGHSLADYRQTQAAIDQGLAGFTHLFNAMTQLTSREPGMVGAALTDRRTFFGLIADGHHVHPASLRAAVAARGAAGVMLVTDAMPTVGSVTDRFRIGAVEVRVVAGALRGPDGTLGGSNLDMAGAFRNAVSMIGVDPAVASQMASANPAKFLRMEEERGTLRAGLAADLVHLDDGMQVRHVWIGGSPVQR